MLVRIDRVQNSTARLAIVGMGYVGVPLAEAFCQQGFRVIGIDVDQAKCKLLNKGENPISDRTKAKLLELAPGSLTCFDSYSALSECDVVIICLPTPVDKYHNPDLSILESALPQVFNNIRKGACVILESTTFPGTTTELLGGACDRAGLTVGTDVFIGYSPERENPGVAEFDTRSTPKLISGLDEPTLVVMDALYSKITRTVRCKSTEVAEAAKILENVFRCVNISLVNELKCVFDKLDIDIWEVIDAAATKPFGFMPFYPGPGIGGHCIPVDPFYLSWVARGKKIPTRFIALAGEINDGMPSYIRSQISSILNTDCNKSSVGAKVLVVGAAYKKDVGDIRESPALEIITSMREDGMVVDIVEPHAALAELSMHLKTTKVYTSFEQIGRSQLKSYDLVVILTDHSELNYDFLIQFPIVIYDTRGVFRSISLNKSEAEIRYR